MATMLFVQMNKSKSHLILWANEELSTMPPRVKEKNIQDQNEQIQDEIQDHKNKKMVRLKSYEFGISEIKIQTNLIEDGNDIINLIQWYFYGEKLNITLKNYGVGEFIRKQIESELYLTSRLASDYNSLHPYYDCSIICIRKLNSWENTVRRFIEEYSSVDDRNEENAVKNQESILEIKFNKSYQTGERNVTAIDKNLDKKSDNKIQAKHEIEPIFLNPKKMPLFEEISNKMKHKKQAERRSKILGDLRLFEGIKSYFFLMTFGLLLLISAGSSLDIKRCGEALGMESGAIPDGSITASSSFARNIDPHYARLNSERGGGAWCPASVMQPGVREHIQVDLGGPRLVTALATQGRNAKGLGVEYTEQYSVEYWRPSLGGWHEYTRWDGKKVFNGNSDTLTAVQHSLTPPLHAHMIRVLPHAPHMRTSCMRLEFYGCTDDSGVVSYSAPVGSGEQGDLTDGKYDGRQVEESSEATLEGGLGRLTDGQVGGDFFSLDMGYGKGSGWVAWKNSSFDTGYMELTFEFDQVRNITAVDLFTNNYFSRNVQIFSKAAAFFSIGGKFFNGDPVVHHQQPDKTLEIARNVTIPFKDGRAAKFVRFRLYFSSDWIMLSEVYFKSELLFTNFTLETEQRAFGDIMETPFLLNEDHRPSGSRPEVLIGILTALILLLVVIFILILLVNKHKQYSEQSTSSLLRNTFTMKINMKDLFMNLTPANPPSPPTEHFPQNFPSQHNMFIEGEINTTGPAQLQGQHCKQSLVSAPCPGRAVVSLMPPVGRGFVPNILPNVVQHTNDISLDDLNFCDDPLDEYHDIFATHPREYLGKDIHIYNDGDIPTAKKTSTMSSTGQRHSKHREDGLGDKMLDGHGSRMKYPTHGRERSGSHHRRTRGKSDEKVFGLTDVSKTTKKNFGTSVREKSKVVPASVTWNIAPSMTLPFAGVEACMVPIPMYCLELLSTVGGSHAGEISIYETKNIKALMPDAPRVVQVRTARLRKADTCMEYLRELRFLAGLDHVALARAVGVVTSEAPPLLVLEYSEAGDLCQLLQTARQLSGDPIRFPLLIFVCIQICSAMKYLESLSVVHKDLAARNCLVYPGNRIKVTDMAACNPIYRDDYSILIGEKAVPVRWLSWESILIDRYTCPSTVWSFGVTMWEILGLCKDSPYSHLTLEDILHSAEQQFYGEELKDVLPRPPYCPQELYLLLTECWKRDDALRPTFQQIYNFLSMRYKQHFPSDYTI